MFHLSIAISKLKDIFVHILRKAIANTDFNHEINESTEQCTKLKNECNA